MLDKFDLDTLYIFDKNKYYLYNGNIPNWTNLCHNKIVETETEYVGVIKVKGEEYVVFPYSCNKIEVDVKSTEKENIYKNDIINNIIGTIQTKSSFQGGKPKEFEGKIFFGIDKNNHYSDAGILSLDNLEDESINNNSKELTFNVNKKYCFDVDLVDKKDIKDWMHECDGCIVDIVNMHAGFVYNGITCHTVFRKWCRVISNQK
nr:MAG TPA: hypothetical protein [Caudoviricetes sp.]